MTRLWLDWIFPILLLVEIVSLNRTIEGWRADHAKERRDRNK